MIAALTFAKPEWLLLLIIPPVLGFAAWLAWIKRGDRWKKLVAPRLRDRLTSRRPAWTHFLALGLALTGVAGLITAFAEPESGEEWIEIKSEGRNILFCIDISRSMLTADIEPNRLMAARAAALEILERFPADRVGVLVFSGDVLVQAPLTIDHSFVEDTLAQLTPNDIPNGGSNLTEAVNKGVKMLVDTNQRNNIMVVFSDGEKSSPNLEAAADFAKSEGVFIYALGMGKEGDFIPDPRQADGKFRDRSRNPVFSKLNEEALQTLAERTDGVYSRGIGRSFLIKLDAALMEMDRFEEEARHQRVAKPAHTWFLFGGLLLLMSSILVRCLPFNAASKVAVVFTACLLTTPPAEAGLIADGKAALEDNDPAAAYRAFNEAAEESTGERAARLHLAAGTAAYEAKQWDSATDSFSSALANLPSDQTIRQEQAHYSLANSLYYLGGTMQGEQQVKAWKGAIEHYQQAIELSENPQQATENKAIVEKLLKKRQEQEKKKNEQQKSEEEQQKSEEEQPKSEEEKQKSEEEKQKSEEEKQRSEEEKEKNQKGEDGENNEGEGEDKTKPGEQKESDQSDQSDQTDQTDQNNQPDKPKNGEDKKDDKLGQQGNEDQEKPQDQAKQPQPSKLDQENPPKENETPQQRARRLLRQYADFGGKAPRYIRRPPRRAAQDW